MSTARFFILSVLVAVFSLLGGAVSSVLFSTKFAHGRSRRKKVISAEEFRLTSRAGFVHARLHFKNDDVRSPVLEFGGPGNKLALTVGMEARQPSLQVMDQSMDQSRIVLFRMRADAGWGVWDWWKKASLEFGVPTKGSQRDKADFSIDWFAKHHHRLGDTTKSQIRLNHRRKPGIIISSHDAPILGPDQELVFFNNAGKKQITISNARGVPNIVAKNCTPFGHRTSTVEIDPCGLTPLYIRQGPWNPKSRRFP